jgi:glycogen operon protein
MIASGDELGKTLGGHNNAYVQDNEVSWIDWDLDDERRRLLAFTTELVRLRRGQPVFRRRSFFRGAPVGGSRIKDIVWFRPDGQEMTLIDWQRPSRAAIGLLLAGDALGWRDDLGEPVVGDTFLLFLSAEPEPLRFLVPSASWGGRWELVFDTGDETGERARPETVQRPATIYEPGDAIALAARAVVLLRRTEPERGSWRPLPAARNGSKA